MSWELRFTCNKCNKIIDLGVLNTVGCSYSVTFQLPKDLHYAPNPELCYECGEAAWNAIYLPAKKVRDEKFEALVQSYALLTSGDAAEFLAILNQAENSIYSHASHFNAIHAAAEQRLACQVKP